MQTISASENKTQRLINQFANFKHVNWITVSSYNRKAIRTADTTKYKPKQRNLNGMSVLVLSH